MCRGAQGLGRIVAHLRKGYNIIISEHTGSSLRSVSYVCCRQNRNEIIYNRPHVWRCGGSRRRLNHRCVCRVLDVGERGAFGPLVSMTALRTTVFTGLLLFILTAGYCKQSATDDRSLLDILMDKIRVKREHHTEDGEGDTQHPPKKEYSIQTGEENEVNRSYQHDQILEVFPRDLRQKDKFLKHLTGPLYFSPKCSKHFNRLYNTRDCTIPAYYKRCARLLTRLAGSQRCSEG
ncbi:ALK and LTK ligand 2b isoform X1 [Brachyhypopomus gauderio]|uniref:ALK and LTK ligand 2b isoform X1 n=1 Tax=Brachyhypopomus gauderio TaxID=698409 RepID=UPI00404151C1